MLHSSSSLQHYTTVNCKAGINKNIRGALIEVTHVQQYTARCHMLQEKREVTPSLPSQKKQLTLLYYQCIHIPSVASQKLRWRQPLLKKKIANDQPANYMFLIISPVVHWTWRRSTWVHKCHSPNTRPRPAGVNATAKLLCHPSWH